MWTSLISACKQLTGRAAPAQIREKTRTKRHAPSRLGLESLERRELMAGDVTVKFVNGDLVITGDNASNSVEIYQTSLDNYKVVGKTIGGSATKINGRVGGSFTFNLYDSRFTDDVNITMNGGHDNVNIHGSSGEFYDIDAKGDFNLSMGTGDDQIQLDYVDAWNDLIVDMGTGRDNIWATNVTVGDDLLLTKNSSSTTDWSAMVFGNVSVVDDFSVKTTNSRDAVNISNSAANDLIISLGASDDGLNLYKTRARSTHSLDGGAGNDNLNLYRNLTTFRPVGFKSPTNIDSSWLY